MLHFTEQIGQQPVPVGMMAYLQYGIQQFGDMYQSRSSWRELGYEVGHFHPFLSLYGSWRPHRCYRCHWRSCNDCLVHDPIFLFVNTWALAAR